MTSLTEAIDFIRQFYSENNLSGEESRINEVSQEIRRHGFYQQTLDEITFGARVAWRNSNRCIGRLFWPSLQVLDARKVETEEEAFDALVHHLRLATNHGKIKSTLTVFNPHVTEPIRLWNRQLIRYAGYNDQGDPMEKDFTQFCLDLGWKGAGTPYDILPWVIQKGNRSPRWFPIPSDVVLEVNIHHPHFTFLEELGLKWYAVPAISSMPLKIGGITYPLAPFNGWYMLSEIATRNFGDAQRYNVLLQVAELAGLDTSRNKTLWKDEALLILNKAVQYSFDQAGVRLVDPHTAGEQFDRFCQAEELAGRTVNADWTWIIPPTAGSTLNAFHRDFPNEIIYPNFLESCPFHHVSKQSLVEKEYFKGI